MQQWMFVFLLLNKTKSQSTRLQSVYLTCDLSSETFSQSPLSHHTTLTRRAEVARVNKNTIFIFSQLFGFKWNISIFFLSGGVWYSWLYCYCYNCDISVLVTVRSWQVHHLSCCNVTQPFPGSSWQPEYRKQSRSSGVRRSQEISQEGWSTGYLILCLS